MGKKTKPTLRFKGFTDDWEQRKFKEMTEIKSASRVHKEEWEKKGVPFYRSSDVMSKLNGTQNEKVFIAEALYEKLSSVSGKIGKGDVLVTGGGSVGRPYLVPDDAPLYTKDADLIWIKANDKLDSQYTYYYFFTPIFREYLDSISHVGTIAHYTITQVGETPISKASRKEQEKIGVYFAQLDNLITLHQRKYERLVQIKKSMLEKMFPQNDEKVPRIRFKGFTDDWEQRKLGKLYNPLTERNVDLLPYNKTLSVATMTFKSEGNGASDNSLTNYKRLRTGDIAFEGHTSKEFRYGRFVLNDVGDGIMSPRFSALRPIKKMPISFWKYYIHYEPIMRKILVNSTKAGTMMNELVCNDFLQEIISIPNETEQVKIGNLLKQLDYLITLHQRKLDKLKNIKKSCLEKMFV